MRAQTFLGWEHLVEVDTNREGCAVVMNRLAAAAQGKWLLPFADDDLMLPGALKTLLGYAKNGARIVYAQPLVFGKAPEAFCQEPPRIPSFALIDRSLWFELDGYNETLNREEDRHMWTAAQNAGVEFVKANGAPTWVYRFHEGNKSFNAGVAS